MQKHIKCPSCQPLLTLISWSTEEPMYRCVRCVLMRIFRCFFECNRSFSDDYNCTCIGRFLFCVQCDFYGLFFFFWFYFCGYDSHLFIAVKVLHLSFAFSIRQRRRLDPGRQQHKTILISCPSSFSNCFLHTLHAIRKIFGAAVEIRFEREKVAKKNWSVRLNQNYAVEKREKKITRKVSDKQQKKDRHGNHTVVVDLNIHPKERRQKKICWNLFATQIFKRSINATRGTRHTEFINCLNQVRSMRFRTSTDWPIVFEYSPRILSFDYDTEWLRWNCHRLGYENLRRRPRKFNRDLTEQSFYYKRKRNRNE